MGGWRSCLPNLPTARARPRAAAPAVAGDVTGPGDDGYDGAAALEPERRLAAGDRATAQNPAGVRAAVLAAREYGLPLAIQATGHGAVVPADGALLLKT